MRPSKKTRQQVLILFACIFLSALKINQISPNALKNTDRTNFRVVKIILQRRENCPTIDQQIHHFVKVFEKCTMIRQANGPRRDRSRLLPVFVRPLLAPGLVWPGFTQGWFLTLGPLLGPPLSEVGAPPWAHLWNSCCSATRSQAPLGAFQKSCKRKTKILKSGQLFHQR